MPSKKQARITRFFYGVDVEKLSHQSSFQPIETAGTPFLRMVVRYEHYDGTLVDDIEDVCEKFCG